MRWKPRLRTVLLAVNLFVLILPLAGIQVLRLYESALIARTETQLIAQAVLVGAAFRDALLRELQYSASDGALSYGIPIPPNKRQQRIKGEPFAPIQPILDVARASIYPPAPDAIESLSPADPYARAAGEQIDPMLFTARTVILSGIRVTDFRGTVVASTGSELGLSLVTRSEVRCALHGVQCSLIRERIPRSPRPPLQSISRGARVRVFVAIPITSGDRIIGTVTASRTPLDLMKALYLKRFLLLSAGAVLLVVVAIISVFTSLTVSKPVRALIRQTQRVSIGEKGATTPISNPVTFEVEELSKAVAKMAVTLDKQAEYIKTFASNVSHGFKTPLTSIRGIAELLQDHIETMPKQKRKRFLNNLVQDADRLERLVGRLTDLARAEVVQPGTEITEVTSVLNEIVKRYAGICSSINVENGGSNLLINMAPETFDSVITNLIDNSIKHGYNAVEVVISTRAIQFDSRKFIEITVKDNGPGISLANVDKVFEPFFTTAGGEGGTGLGLSIVHALLSAHQGDIRIDPVESGAQITICLPCASVRASSSSDA